MNFLNGRIFSGWHGLLYWLILLVEWWAWRTGPEKLILFREVAGLDDSRALPNRTPGNAGIDVMGSTKRVFDLARLWEASLNFAGARDSSRVSPVDAEGV
jgi:hypothetical protein